MDMWRLLIVVCWLLAAGWWYSRFSSEKSDFTCYPAATQNEIDFFNLLDVYLDAVFYPTLSELSFAQEGYCLDFEADREESLPSLQIGAKIFTKDHYTLSNCLFFFYGDIPLEKHLDYLEKISFQPINQRLQPRFEAPRSTSIYYPVDAIDVKNPHLLLRCVGKENEKRIEMELINALQKIAQDGVPEQLIESAFHQIELDRSEIIGDGKPFGLVLYFQAAFFAHHNPDSTWAPYTSPRAPRLMNQNRD
ncbi:hypothetical protein ACTFIW_013300 [Dictyostelium discoideum]